MTKTYKTEQAAKTAATKAAKTRGGAWTPLETADGWTVVQAEAKKKKPGPRAQPKMPLGELVVAVKVEVANNPQKYKPAVVEAVTTLPDDDIATLLGRSKTVWGGVWAIEQHVA